MSTTTIRRVSHLEILAAHNAQELIDEYAAECSVPQIGRIAPQIDSYALLEANGALSCFGVFEDEELIGFASLLMSVSPHYGRRVAAVESLFIAKRHRSGRTGAALRDAIEDLAARAGCVAIVYAAPVDSEFAMVLAFSPPYTETSVIYVRSLA